MRTWLNSTRATRQLQWVFLFVLTCVVVVFRHYNGSDVETYLSLADGIKHANYSLWWFLPVEIPDTIRTPGYPMFLAFFRLWTESLVPIIITQFVMFLLAVRMLLRVIGQLGGGTMGANLFLLLLVPSINLHMYVSQIGAEIPTLFLLSAWAYVQICWRDERWTKHALSALLLFGAYQCRPAALLLPVAWVVVRSIWSRTWPSVRGSLIMLGVFGLACMPYGYWNLQHNGTFSVTPLESGGGVMHIGWWSDKIAGHREMRYWGNVTPLELVRFTPEKDVEANWIAFNKEWDRIDSATFPLLTAKDTIMLAEFPKYNLFRGYNSRFVMAREAMLKKLTIEHMKAEPGYTFAIKAYTAVRLWITGIQTDQWAAASMGGKVKLLYAFLFTLGIFLLAVITVPLALIRQRLKLKDCLVLLVPVLYFGLIHIPFCIQARYTIPVRPMLLVLIALAVSALLRKDTIQHEKRA